MQSCIRPIVNKLKSILWSGLFFEIKTLFPPNSNKCPDYWNVNLDGTCTAKVKSDNTYLNTGLLTMPLPTLSAPYATNNNTFDPSDVKWSTSGKSTLCAQRDWSLQQGVEWQGISNYNGC